MRKILFLIALLSALSILLVACGGGGEEEAAETTSSAEAAARGEALYKSTTIGTTGAPGCVTCHSLEEGVTLVGPSHAGIGAAAGSRVPGMSAEEYLRQSIVDPDAHLEDNFSPGVMYQNFGTDLTEQQISDLVAFLMTLK
jgi:mono/diheme cytochrome c family protein